MSPRNTLRFFAVFTTIVLSIVGSPVPELVDRLDDISPDLEQQASITVEVKSDLKRTNDIKNLPFNNAKDDPNAISDSDGIKKNSNKGSYQTPAIMEKKAALIDIDAKNISKTTPIAFELTTDSFVESISNVTKNNQTNNITKVENPSPQNNLEATEKNNLVEEAVNSQENITINGNHTEATTASKTEPSIQATLLDTKESVITTQPENETTVTETEQATLLNIKESSNETQTGNETSAPVTTTKAIISEKSAKPFESSSSVSGVTTPMWKKYTTIERKRVAADIATDEPEKNTFTDDSAITEQTSTIQEKSEVMVKSESTVGRITLQDAITSDIPSLEKLKSDLLSYPKNTTKSDSEPTTLLILTEESINKADLTTSMVTTLPSTLQTEVLNTVSSKRAGYLDLTMKNTSTADESNLRPNGTETLQGPFETEPQDELSEYKIEKRIESQSQLDEDAIKEELLKEEMMNDNEEISKRLRGTKEIEIYSPALPSTNNTTDTQFDDKVSQLTLTLPDDNLSVRPINSDKAKNTILYPVNPNYKPLKKIEVQPAKPFVRDPDDNSWRNESLSSLGIVFKPKNSSKPFTQVLKNKTETEWNNLSEKERKSEVPDLRVRLEQITQKRKSKKKKIDSLGNVYYTDYEESSSSEENTTTPQVEDPSSSTISTTEVPTTAVTIVTPVQNTSLSPSTPSIPNAIDVPALTTTVSPTEKTQTTPKKDPVKFSTQKPRKMLNLFDYYEPNDEEDISDYLNMAKIDLKKFTVPIHTTYSPYTSPPLPILFTNPMTQYTQERKGTIQYFPPRTTKRPRKNKSNNVREKVNSFSESPKHVLPVSYHKLTTTPYDSNIYYTNSPDMTRLKEDLAPKHFDQSLYLTTPPLTTLPDEDFSVINEGEYNRPNYVMKHYKDYLNVANQGQDHNKHRSYPFTEPPEHDAITDYIKPATVKDKTTVTEDYDYESQFRKDILDRFVANFNEKSNRFKSDFPVVYNNSIVHGPSYDDKEAAMSRAYFRRPYSNQDYKPLVHDPYDPNCDNVTVELSPAYELHYYVPDQEEKQEVEAKPINLPVPGRYR